MLSRKYDKERVAGKRKAGKVFHKDTTKPNTEDKGAGRVRVAAWETLLLWEWGMNLTTM